MPTTFVGLALFVAFATPGYMWVRVEERARPRPDRSQLLEAAELLTVGAVASLISAAIVATLGSFLRPLLDVAAWARAADPSAYVQAAILSTLTSLLLTVLLANVGASLAAGWWFSSRGRRQRESLRERVRQRLKLGPPSQPRIQTANTPWYDVLGSIDKTTHVAILTVIQT